VQAVPYAVNFPLGYIHTYIYIYKIYIYSSLKPTFVEKPLSTVSDRIKKMINAEI
jgi:hypothetical protein